MKKVLAVIAVILVLAVLAGGGWAFAVLNSPQYALAEIAEDVQRAGVDGLEPHLTDEAQEMLDKIDSTLDMVSSLSEHKILGAIMSALDIESGIAAYIDTLKTEIDEVEWSLGDVLANFKKAVVCLNFNYNDEITGSIDLKMVREDGEWKISGFGFPRFDEFVWP